MHVYKQQSENLKFKVSTAYEPAKLVNWTSIKIIFKNEGVSGDGGGKSMQTRLVIE